MYLIRRRPTDLPSIENLMSRVLDDPFFGLRANGADPVDEGTLALDVSEDERDVIVRASLPGFSKDDVDVEVHDGVLTIKAEHTEEKEETGEQYYRKERRFGSMSRRVALPSAVQDDGGRAELKDGVLTLRLPKVNKSVAKKVKID